MDDYSLQLQRINLVKVCFHCTKMNGKQRTGGFSGNALFIFSGGNDQRKFSLSLSFSVNKPLHYLLIRIMSGSQIADVGNFTYFIPWNSSGFQVISWSFHDWKELLLKVDLIILLLYPTDTADFVSGDVLGFKVRTDPYNWDFREKLFCKIWQMWQI